MFRHRRRAISYEDLCTNLVFGLRERKFVVQLNEPSMNVELKAGGAEASSPAKAGPSRDLKFKAIFCREYHCSSEEFSKKLFWLALYSHARIPAIFLRIFHPSYFHIDSEFIHDIGETQYPEMFRGEIDTYYGNNLRSRSWMRNKLLIRLSGTKMKKLGAKLLGEIPRSAQ